MKKITLIGLLFYTVSCSSIDSYLKDKNYITFNDNVKYKVIENKVEKDKITKKVVEDIPKKIDNVKKEVINKEVVEKQVVNNKSSKITEKVVEETPKKIDNVKKEVINKEVVEKQVVNNKSSKITEKGIEEIAKKNESNKKNNSMEEKTSTQIINQLTKRVSESTVNFTSEDEKIIQYISGIVVENESQIKAKTLDSINRLKQKGINLTTKEFLALAYKNIKDTRVNSYILAVARVMNNVERGKK